MNKAYIKWSGSTWFQSELLKLAQAVFINEKQSIIWDNMHYINS